MIHKKEYHKESVLICWDFQDGHLDYQPKRCWYRHTSVKRTSEKDIKTIIKFDENIYSKSHYVISNINQRASKTPGWRPALIVKKNKYQIHSLTNTVINIPWELEMLWALLNPNSFSNGCVTKNIVLGAIYVRPSKPKKSLIFDHIADVYNVLNSKYGKRVILQCSIWTINLLVAKFKEIIKLQRFAVNL